MRWSTQARASIGASLAWSTSRAVSPWRSGGEVFRSAGASPLAPLAPGFAGLRSGAGISLSSLSSLAHGGGKVEGRGG